jgi:hypothetical protein
LVNDFDALMSAVEAPGICPPLAKAPDVMVRAFDIGIENPGLAGLPSCP